MSDLQYMVELGAKLRGKRAELGLSQADLADVVGVSPAAISTWEAGTATIGSTSLARLEAYFRQQRKAKGLPAEVSA
jgi:transcriptional regulator with XRE-family HTH domain